MRLGGPLPATAANPEQWVQGLRDHGYRAAYCPVGPGTSPDTIAAYAVAAQKADIVIAEVGAWSNPLAPDETARRAALDKCKNSLALADAIGARCCVNIAGSKGPKWDGPCREDLTDDTFDLIVQVVRNIIDAVRPTRSCYCLETMPWMFPDSADSYLALIKAIDRKAFGVHFDPVNLVCSPQTYFRNGADDPRLHRPARSAHPLLSRSRTSFCATASPYTSTKSAPASERSITPCFSQNWPNSIRTCR